MLTFKDDIAAELSAIRQAGLYKEERELTSAQGVEIETTSGQALNFCANNYLGLADDSRVRETAHEALDQWGFGMSSVRFICGTQSPHRELERELADWLGTQDAILFSSCFDANGAVFAVLLGEQDAVVSDELNHASIIDGVRLCKAARYRYRNGDTADLRAQIEAARAAGARRVMVVTDGVFSMDGSYAPLPQIVEVADELGALVMVDDSHATGFVGATGAGTPELWTCCRGRWARRWAVPAAATWPGRARSSTCCASGPAPTCSPTRWRRPWWAEACGRCGSRATPTAPARSWPATPSCSAR